MNKANQNRKVSSQIFDDMIKARNYNIIALILVIINHIIIPFTQNEPNILEYYSDGFVLLIYPPFLSPIIAYISYTKRSKNEDLKSRFQIFIAMMYVFPIMWIINNIYAFSALYFSYLSILTGITFLAYLIVEIYSILLEKRIFDLNKGFHSLEIRAQFERQKERSTQIMEKLINKNHDNDIEGLNQININDLSSRFNVEYLCFLRFLIENFKRLDGIKIYEDQLRFYTQEDLTTFIEFLDIQFENWHIAEQDTDKKGVKKV